MILTMTPWTVIFLITLSYCLGSISSAILLSRWLSSSDPREQGSGNPGTTNVLRTSGKGLALAVLVADVSKGFLPVFLSQLLGATSFTQGLIALAACIGHVFPLFFNFKGGKGVATTLGGLLAIAWLPTLACLVIWIVVIIITRYVSLGSILAAACAPICFWLLDQPQSLSIIVGTIGTVVIAKHHSNIKRLWKGQESKIKLPNSSKF